MTNADFSSSVSVPIKLLSEGGREQIKGAYENLVNNRIRKVPLDSHRLAYKNVINFKALWNKTTDAYKGFNVRKLLKYTKDETKGKN